MSYNRLLIKDTVILHGIDNAEKRLDQVSMNAGLKAFTGFVTAGLDKGHRRLFKVGCMFKGSSDHNLHNRGTPGGV